MEAAVTKLDGCPAHLSRAFAVRSRVITRAGRSFAPSESHQQCGFISRRPRSATKILGGAGRDPESAAIMPAETNGRTSTSGSIAVGSGMVVRRSSCPEVSHVAPPERSRSPAHCG